MTKQAERDYLIRLRESKTVPVEVAYWFFGKWYNARHKGRRVRWDRLNHPMRLLAVRMMLRKEFYEFPWSNDFSLD